MKQETSWSEWDNNIILKFILSEISFKKLMIWSKQLQNKNII